MGTKQHLSTDDLGNLTSIHVDHLNGPLLDYFVALVYKRTAFINKKRKTCSIAVETPTEKRFVEFSPSSLWRHGGPLIELEKLTVEFIERQDQAKMFISSYGSKTDMSNMTLAYSSNPLEAVCKTIIRKHIGHKVNLSEYKVVEISD